jgi:Flp pilus assembly protein TadD
MTRRFCLILSLALLLAGCGLPKITVLSDPLSSQEHLKLGLAYEKQGKFDLATQEYLTAAKELPVANLYAGNAFFQLGRDGDAEGAYRQAIKAQPDNPRPYNNLAWLLCARGEELAEAEFLAQRAVALAPPGQKATYQDTLDRVRKARQSGQPACPRP